MNPRLHIIFFIIFNSISHTLYMMSPISLYYILFIFNNVITQYLYAQNPSDLTVEILPQNGVNATITIGPRGPRRERYHAPPLWLVDWRSSGGPHALASACEHHWDTRIADKSLRTATREWHWDSSKSIGLALIDLPWCYNSFINWLPDLPRDTKQKVLKWSTTII